MQPLGPPPGFSRTVLPSTKSDLSQKLPGEVERHDVPKPLHERERKAVERSGGAAAPPFAEARTSPVRGPFREES
jgi:hypothetical protein